MTLTENLAYWLAHHPRARRAVTAMSGVWFLSMWALITAPTAAASTGSAVIAWTGLKDADGVPLNKYFLSVVDTSEAVTNNGQGIDLLDPNTLLSWLGGALQAAVTHSTAAWWLTTFAGIFLTILGFCFWFLKFALSNAWLLALAEVGRPVYAAVQSLSHQMLLGPLALLICVCIAGTHYMFGRKGRAYGILGKAAILFVLLLTVFSNPIEDLVSEHGLLGVARSTGFEMALSMRNGTYVAGGSLDAQLNALMGQLISNTARPALQLQNFGMVVDNIGSCRSAWSQAMMNANGQGPGPAHAMAACGAPQAVAHAQQLGASDLVLGGFFIAMGLLIGVFIWWVGISTMLVGVKALFYGIAVGPAFLLGMTGWSRAENYAKHCGTELLLHFPEMIIFTAYLGITSVGMGWALTTPMLGQSGLSVVPRMLLVGIGSIVALVLFYVIDKHFYADGRSTIMHNFNSVWNAGKGTAQREYDDLYDGYDRAREFGSRVRNRLHGKAGEEADGEAVDAGASSGTGFDTVKPRPDRRPDPGETLTVKTPATTTKPATTATEAAEHGEHAAATVAARAGAAEGTTAAAGAVEAAATVVAPEVALPAAAAVAAAHHMGGKHHSDGQQSSPHGSSPSTSDLHDPESTAGLAHPTVAQRPSKRRELAADLQEPRAKPAGEPQPNQDPPLEFPTTARAPQSPAHSATEGDQQ